jgi:hypothetical protein
MPQRTPFFPGADPVVAAAVGNYDFGFGHGVLLAYAGAAGFLFLTANVTLADTDEFAGFAQRYVIREVSGVQVAIVGLTTTCTPYIVMPAFVEGLAPVCAEFSVPLLAGYREAFPPARSPAPTSSPRCPSRTRWWTSNRPASG